MGFSVLKPTSMLTDAAAAPDRHCHGQIDTHSARHLRCMVKPMGPHFHPSHLYPCMANGCRANADSAMQGKYCRHMLDHRL